MVDRRGAGAAVAELQPCVLHRPRQQLEVRAVEHLEPELRREVNAVVGGDDGARVHAATLRPKLAQREVLDTGAVENPHGLALEYDEVPVSAPERHDEVSVVRRAHLDLVELAADRVLPVRELVQDADRAAENAVVQLGWIIARAGGNARVHGTGHEHAVVVGDHVLNEMRPSR